MNDTERYGCDQTDVPDGWRVYHRDRAGQPDLHTDPGGPYYYEPVDTFGGEVWSEGYPTPRAAIAACLAEAFDNA